MLSLGTSLRRLRAFALGRFSQSDLDEELAYHVDLLTMDYIESGMSPDQARVKALGRFGDLKKIKRHCQEVHRGSLPGAMTWFMGLVVVCGVFLWISPYSSQTNVLGQMLAITVLLFRLLMCLRAWPAVIGNRELHSSEFNLFGATPINSRKDVQPSLNRFSTFVRIQMLRIVALCAVIVCCLCAGVVASSATALSNHLKLVQENTKAATEKFVGTWVVTVGDVYDRKDLSTSPPFSELPQGMPRDLPLAKIIIELQNGNLTGKRLLYSYSPGANSQSPVVEKGEVDLVNVRAQGNILTGNVTGSNGEQLPGGWEIKLTSDTEAEVRATGNDLPQEQKRLVLKLRRLPK